MSEASELGAVLGAYLDPDARAAAGGIWGRGTPENPVRGVHFFGICNHAMQNGLELTFVVEGPNAQEAAGRVRRLLDKPLSRAEVSAKTRRWVAGNRGQRAPDGDYERAELRATLPGEGGIECIFYQYLARATTPLRTRVYITVVAEGEEFRPSGVGEHFPVSELSAYQTAAGGDAFAAKLGRSLEVAFVCYSPPGSGAAAEAVQVVADALEKLREVATWEDGKRSWFGLRHGLGAAVAMIGDATSPSYRPPKGVLSHRSSPPSPPAPPKPGPRRVPNGVPNGAGLSIGGRVNDLLRSWATGVLPTSGSRPLPNADASASVGGCKRGQTRPPSEATLNGWGQAWWSRRRRGGSASTGSGRRSNGD